MAILLVKGFSSVKGSAYNRTEWGSRMKSDSDYRRGCVQQWDILELRPDFYEPGRMEGWLAKDTERPCLPDKNTASGRYPCFNIRVPSILLSMKPLVEQQVQVWPVYGRDVAQRRDAGPMERVPLDDVRCGFYVDYASLPDHAKLSLLCEGNCTLNEIEARAAIKHKLDESLVVKLFTDFMHNGQ